MARAESLLPSPPIRRWALLLVVAASLGSVLWFGRLVADVPPLIVAAALVPALLYAWAVTVIDREAEPRLALIAALFGGAVVAAHLSHTLNDWLLAWVNTRVAADDVRPLAGGFGAPVIEEVAKAAVLVVLAWVGRDLLDGALDGIVYGALVGIGFAFSENIVYFTFSVLTGGAAGLMQAVYVRALLGGFNHAAFTATTGAALGHVWTARWSRGRLLLPILGLGFAIVQHVVWNAVAANAISGVLCGPELAGGPCRVRPSETSLFVMLPILFVIFLAPGVVTLSAIAVLARARAASRLAAKS